MPATRSPAATEFRIGQTWRTQSAPTAPSWLVTHVSGSGASRRAILRRQGRPGNYKGPGTLMRGPDVPKGWTLLADSGV